MASQKEFQTAGKKPGLQVWRIEKMELAPVPEELYGSFYDGDSYIVLFTTKEFSYKVHMWSGNHTSQDEKGAAAILMTQMDYHLGGKPVQFIEFQNDESVAFMKYFKSGIRYMKGGVASGFQHVVTNEINIKRALKVKGRRMIRATEVSLNWSSFNKGDCFIIDLGKIIYHWSGLESNYFERLKATEVAKDIRDNERHGRADIEMIEEGSEPEAVIKVLGPKPDLPSCDESEKKKCDERADQKNKKMATLYLISDAGGSMKTTEVATETPFKQDMLSQNECYILYNRGGKNIFVWKGKNANADERREALNRAREFIKANNCDPDTKIQIIPAGAETSIFKQFYFNWLDKDETTGPSEAYSENKIAKVAQIPFDASTLHNNKCMAAQHHMVDDGSGKTEIWRVEGGGKKPVSKSTYGQFFGGDCYLVLYTYNEGGREKFIIYTWQGQKCSKDELGASAILTIELDDSYGGRATQVRVTQGQEPPHLVSVFKDKPLIVYLGGTSRHDQEGKPECKPNSTRLFHIRQSSNKSTRAVEVEPKASSLNTNDVFVLKEGDSVYIWKGKGATQEEMAAADYVVSVLSKGKTAKQVEETKEPADFWKALGGKAEYQTSKTLQNTVKPPRLFGCSNKTGNLIAEEVPGDFTQLDLATDDIMILDTWDELYVWVGKDANETEKAGVAKIAQEYLDSDPSGRSQVPITTTKQGAEPVTFTGWFHAWDPDMWRMFEKGSQHDFLQQFCKK